MQCLSQGVFKARLSQQSHVRSGRQDTGCGVKPAPVIEARHAAQVCVWRFAGLVTVVLALSLVQTGESLVPQPLVKSVAPQTQAPAPAPLKTSAAVPAPPFTPEPISNLQTGFELDIAPTTVLAEPEIVLAANVSPPSLEIEPEIVEAPALKSDLDDLSYYGDELARHLEHQESDHLNVAFLRWDEMEGRSSVMVGKIQASYGSIFKGESAGLHWRNGTAWQEPGCLILKASFRF